MFLSSGKRKWNPSGVWEKSAKSSRCERRINSSKHQTHFNQLKNTLTLHNRQSQYLHHPIYIFTHRHLVTIKSHAFWLILREPKTNLIIMMFIHKMQSKHRSRLSGSPFPWNLFHELLADHKIYDEKLLLHTSQAYRIQIERKKALISIPASRIKRVNIHEHTWAYLASLIRNQTYFSYLSPFLSVKIIQLSFFNLLT